jgi:hypothetical protein
MMASRRKSGLAIVSVYREGGWRELIVCFKYYRIS